MGQGIGLLLKGRRGLVIQFKFASKFRQETLLSLVERIVRLADAHGHFVGKLSCLRSRQRSDRTG